ncbi:MULTISPECIES: type II secretion system protein N [unclassified Psychrobacter]|uniref:type II secretion system protein N n=1 Tax=unclassified Psychrobacter TaxID=196806 RepID=UPI00078C55EB|nr:MULTISPECIES: type II secretion system protein N [unclassified Psychrobacter]AMN50293.1 general secretion pathway protein [Psychrobacter sp. P2G3]AMN68197.1 general secretion pathway protein [Psychrobacter sp. P11G5]
MPKASASSHKRPRKLWWLVGFILFTLFALLQMPAAWVIEKYAPDSPYVQHVSGNLWQGSAIWQLPVATIPLTGSADWSWQPWQLFLGKIGADIDISTGQTRLDGQIKVGRNAWQVADMSGKIAPETLAGLVDWQLPNTPIQVNAISLQRKSGSDPKSIGFTKADGQLTWVGGEVGYPSGGKVFYITMPAMRAELSTEQKNDTNLLHMNLLDNQDKRLGDLYLDGDNMLDVSLTQRLLENMPEYEGQAPKDTAVVSVRQPLMTGLGVR